MGVKPRGSAGWPDDGCCRRLCAPVPVSVPRITEQKRTNAPAGQQRVVGRPHELAALVQLNFVRHLAQDGDNDAGIVDLALDLSNMKEGLRRGGGGG